MFDLRGKVIVVTGAVGLLGREQCKALARQGAHVVVSDMGAAGCKGFADELEVEFGVACLGHAADVTGRESLDGLRTAILDRFGRIDGLVHNAAIDDKVDRHAASDGDAGKRGAAPIGFEDYPVELFRKVIDVNITGTFLICQVLGGEMARRGVGSIVNVSSTYGLVSPDQRLYARPDGSVPFIKSAAYPTSKAAVIMLTKYLANYWGRAGVRVNALCPGGVATSGTEEYFKRNYGARTAVGRMASPDDYRGAVVFLMSDESRYMTGSALVVDGGWTAT